MVQGEFSGNSMLVLGDHNSKVEWYGQKLVNLIRNSDSQFTWPKFRPEVIVLMDKIDYRIGAAANSLVCSFDLQANFWYTRESLKTIFRSFWGEI